MASSLSNLANNLSEGIHRIKCKFGHDDKNCVRHVELNIATVLEYTNLEDVLIECKCLCCNKNYQNKFEEKLKEQFFNTYTISNFGNNKFILLLQQGVHPYEYMDNWGKFDEASLPQK